MKCGAWAVSITSPRGKKRIVWVVAGRVRNQDGRDILVPVETAQSWKSHSRLGVSRKNKIGPLHRCKGNLTAHISVRMHDYVASPSAYLDVTYICDKCHFHHYEAILPLLEEEVSEFLTKAVADMPELE